MALKIRRGTDAQRSGVTFDQGEIVWTTDAQKLWVGDGITQGGVPVVGSSVVGYGLSFNNTTKRVELGTVYTDDITESPTAVKKFFTQELAQDAAALLFTTGIHTNISVQYDDQAGRINLTVGDDLVGITSVVADTNPQLGGNLDLNSNDITGTGNVDIDGSFITSGLEIAGSEIVGSIPASSYATVDPNTNVVAIGSNAVKSMLFVHADAEGMIIRSTASNSIGATVELQSTRFSGAAPAPVIQNDLLGGFAVKGYNGTTYKRSAVIQSRITSTITGGEFNSDLEVFVSNSTGNFSPFTFKATGLFETSGVTLNPLSTATISAANSVATNGSLVYNSDLQALQVKTGANFITVPTVVAVPAYSNSAGKTGQIAGDANYVYFCYADASWVRVPKDNAFGPAP